MTTIDIAETITPGRIQRESACRRSGSATRMPASAPTQTPSQSDAPMEASAEASTADAAGAAGSPPPAEIERRSLHARAHHAIVKPA